MEKLTVTMDRYFARMDERCKALPNRTQRKYTLYFFAAYFALTAGVLIQVCYEVGTSRGNMIIDHIENPVLKKLENAAIRDTLSTILKNKIYERE
ncbi:nitrogen regulatory IIA protein [uncultured Flavobacterium sp.]|jgi:hypothetical protein|uniref:nitrogen regulatory IIA protein n=1 Tax=uncultured Flavobacterium sp. TaxID=165435 RepID=UPI0025F365E3|nr:nitrogen regulatory IIA protein [uncultured Flavobacterium sp.]